MKKILISMLILLSAVCTLTAQPQMVNNTFKIGDVAPDLKYNNPEGKIISLKEVNQGRYILLDFWASWCKPCRFSNPALVAFYKEHKDKQFRNAEKGFTVFSVSLDQRQESWVKAIKDDQLEWPYHISDLGGWTSEPATVYGIEFIPQVFLIGPDGKIIGMYAESGEAFEDLKQYIKN